MSATLASANVSFGGSALLSPVCFRKQPSRRPTDVVGRYLTGEAAAGHSLFCLGGVIGNRLLSATDTRFR